MDKFLELFDLQDPAKLKRALSALFGVVTVAAAPLLSKYGITVDDNQILSFAGIVAAYLIQSGVHSAAKQIAAAKSAGDEAAAKVETIEEAKKVLVP